MAREIERLKDVQVRNIKEPGYHPDGAGLYLQVSPSLTKSWIFRYTRTGKTREMGLGSYLALTLKEARDAAKAQRKLLAEGRDPIDTRDALKTQEVLAKANTLTFDECAKKYIATNKAGWKNGKHADQWQNTLDTYASPVIGKLPIQAIDTGLVLRVLEPIWAEKPETASRVRGRIESVLNWATAHKYRSGDNPARWRGHLDKILPKRSKVARVQHHEALPYSEINPFITELRKQPGIAPMALEFAILTAARTEEVVGAKPGEFNLEKGVWTIPGERMKAGREHRVPLSPRAIEILQAQPDSEYVFSGRWENKPMSNGAMLMVLERMGKGDITVHGFRSTFRDWAAETTNYPREVCEMALAHTLKDKTEAAYRRGDLFEKRRLLMLDWAKYCLTPKAAGKVVPMKRKAQK
jgi:integrase